MRHASPSAGVSKKLGGDLNRSSKALSMGIPIFNMLVCGIVYIGLYAVLDGRAIGVFHLFPCEMYSCGVIFAKSSHDVGTAARMILPIFQFALYFLVSILSYLVAKKKAEDSEGVKKLRGEKKKPNNRFGIDIDI